MANWKKMAEAFGRAMSGIVSADDAKTPAQKLVQGVHEASEKDEFDRFLETGRIRENPGNSEYFRGQHAMSKKTPDLNVEYTVPGSKEHADITEELTDRGLQNDFTKLFEEAAAKASPELRVQAIEMLQRGESIPDVLDVLKWGD